MDLGSQRSQWLIYTQYHIKQLIFQKFLLLVCRLIKFVSFLSSFEIRSIDFLGIDFYPLSILLSKTFSLKLETVPKLLIWVVLNMSPLVPLMLWEQNLWMKVFNVILDLSLIQVVTHVFVIWLTQAKYKTGYIGITSMSFNILGLLII